MEVAQNISIDTTLLIIILSIILVFKGIKSGPQSEVIVVERFGKFTKKLNAGSNFLIPFLERVAHIY